MGKEKKKETPVKKVVPAAKPVALVALSCLIAICGLFFAGLVKVPKITFSGIADRINWQIDSMHGLDGLGGVCLAILESLWPIIALIFALVIVLKVVLCWIPLTKVGSLGWSVVCIRISKKLRGAAVWVLSYMVFCFTVFGQNAKFTVYGIIALALIAAFILGRVIFDHYGKKEKPDKTVHKVCNISSSAVFLGFSLFMFIYMLSRSAVGLSLWGRLFYSFESMLKGEAFAGNFMYILSVVLLLVSISLTRNVLKKQITLDKVGARVSVIILFVLIVIATLLDYFAYGQYVVTLSVGVWLDSPATKYISTVFLLGAIALILKILTDIIGNIGKEKEPDEDDEDGEKKESEDEEDDEDVDDEDADVDVDVDVDDEDVDVDVDVDVDDEDVEIADEDVDEDVADEDVDAENVELTDEELEGVEDIEEIDGEEFVVDEEALKEALEDEETKNDVE